MTQPELAIIVCTYQRPGHLRRVLRSIALQSNLTAPIEVVVADDGSTDETPQVVAQFERETGFPVRWVTHTHTTFQLARCRNEGAAASTAPYLLFVDGDCVLPPYHAQIHLQRRKPRCVMAGYCVRLDAATSDDVSEDVIRSGAFAEWGAPAEKRLLRKMDRKSRFYRLIRHPTKPKLFGGDVGVWRSDFERVNGYDENFRGWGCEDDDLRYRMRRAGVVIESILRWTHTFHLWHPTDPTAGKNWKDGPNVARLLRKGRLTRCRNGLVKRGLDDLAMRVVADEQQLETLRAIAGGPLESKSAANPEVELLVLPGNGAFSGRAELNVLVALEDSAAALRAARSAHVIVSRRPLVGGGERQFPLERLREALADAA